MTEDTELRRNWRTKWLSSIQEFADEETQRRSWLDVTNTNPHYSFVEYWSCYFDDLGLADTGYQWALDEGLVSRAEVEAVSHFHATLRGYECPTDDYDHAAILADVEWAKVVAAAKQGQNSLLTLIDDPHERWLLTEA